MKCIGVNMKDYLISLVLNAQKHVTPSHPQFKALQVLISECDHFKKQFDQFDKNDEEEIEDAISLLCCAPVLNEIYSKEERGKLCEMLRMEAPILVAKF
jgi:hypothetical protein